MMPRLSWILLLAASPLGAQQPVITTVDTHSEAEFRGLHVLPGGVIWASGNGGRYVVSEDSGESWRADSVPGAEAMFFVDVHAFDARHAVLAGTSFDGGEARLYRTADGGRTWTLAWQLKHPAVFLDGIAFWDARRGIAFGDPVDGAFFVLRTENGGASWERVPADRLPPPLAGEAAFAASGTSLAAADGGVAWFGTGGGASARVFRTVDYGRTWTAAVTPLPAGANAGIFGLAFTDGRSGIAVGGDHQQPVLEGTNVLRTRDGGLGWELAGSTTPPGVKYGLAWLGAHVIAPAPRGTSWSSDGGHTWQRLMTDVGYNTAAFAPDGTAWLAGVKGAIAKVEFPRFTPRAAGR